MSRLALFRFLDLERLLRNVSIQMHLDLDKSKHTYLPSLSVVRLYE